MKKILVADDESLIRKLVCDFLKKEGYETIEACDGDDAIAKFEQNGEISLAVIDIMMPGKDGWEVCKTIRKTSSIPIIVLTARSQEFDELTSFEAGADDFVTKPFSPTVLVKRIEVILKRSVAKVNDDIISIDNLSIDLPGRTVKAAGESIELTAKEYDILLKLCDNPNRIFSRDQILDDVWGIDYDGDSRTVDSHVARIRTKLGKWGDDHLKTVYGVGYKVEV